MQSSGQVWTSDPHGSVEWTKLNNSLPLDSPMGNGSDASRGTLLSQGLCEIKGGHICQVQLKQPEKDQICSDESGCLSICNQILLASYFHLQNHGTSHLAFFHSSTLKIYSPISRIPRATSHVLTIAVLLAFVCQFLKKDILPLYLCSCLL